jgi:hypothetical protein
LQAIETREPRQPVRKPRPAGARLRQDRDALPALTMQRTTQQWRDARHGIDRAIAAQSDGSRRKPVQRRLWTLLPGQQNESTAAAKRRRLDAR